MGRLPMSSERVEKVVALTERLIDLRRQMAEVEAEIEGMVPVPGPPTPAGGFSPTPVPSSQPTSQRVDVPNVGSKPLNGVARNGFSRDVFEFMKAHPSQEFTAE